jgi:hypothetical protein
MNMQAALLARLRAVPAIVSLFSSMDWLIRPQGEAFPTLTLQMISETRSQHLKGFNDLRDSRVQIDVWGLTYSEVREGSELVIAALVPENTSNGIVFNRAMVDGVRDLSDTSGTRFVFRSSIDLIVWWQTEEV